MIFLRASESMWLVESQRTRRSRASRARRIRSTCFFRQAIEVSGVRDNCHCPAFRLLVFAGNRRVCPRACRYGAQARTDAAASGRSRRNANGRADALPEWRKSRCTGRVATARTVCLLAGRRRKEGRGTSCRSGSQTVRRSTTAGVQGISPIREDSRF